MVYFQIGEIKRMLNNCVGISRHSCIIKQLYSLHQWFLTKYPLCDFYGGIKLKKKKLEIVCTAQGNVKKLESLLQIFN